MNKNVFLKLLQFLNLFKKLWELWAREEPRKFCVQQIKRTKHQQTSWEHSNQGAGGVFSLRQFLGRARKRREMQRVPSSRDKPMLSWTLPGSPPAKALSGTQGGAGGLRCAIAARVHSESGHQLGDGSQGCDVTHSRKENLGFVDQDKRFTSAPWKYIFPIIQGNCNRNGLSKVNWLAHLEREVPDSILVYYSRHNFKVLMNFLL